MNWIKLGTGVLSGILIGFILYGAGQYYFHKPAPIVNNTTVQPGATLHVEQEKSASSSGHLITGIYGGRAGTGNEMGISLGWIW